LDGKIRVDCIDLASEDSLPVAFWDEAKVPIAELGTIEAKTGIPVEFC